MLFVLSTDLMFLKEFFETVKFDENKVSRCQTKASIITQHTVYEGLHDFMRYICTWIFGPVHKILIFITHFQIPLIKTMPIA